MINLFMSISYAIVRGLLRNPDAEKYFEKLSKKS